MRKIFIILFIFISCFINVFSLDVSFFEEDEFLRYSNKDLLQVRSYYNNELSILYTKIDPIEKNIFNVQNIGMETDITKIISNNTGEYIYITGFKKNEVKWVNEYKIKNDKIIKIIYKRYDTPWESADDSMELVEETIDEFQYQNEKLKIHNRNQNPFRIINYMADGKISDIVYYNNNSSVIDKFEYINNLDYIVTPSHNLTVSIRDGYMSRQDHKEKKSGKYLFIEDVYYTEKNIEEYKKLKYYSSSLVEAERFVQYNKNLSVNKYIYKNDILKSITDNLRLRENGDINAKVIKKLKKNEKVNLQKFGKYEVINNFHGNWVQVKTESGEEGWCFDAYLEEVKEELKK
ncbi:MAG: hypothetical protein A2015_10395 [Spirochaetes bacterium GWF1_31_7]|nr:MAG: hypothetical protein A2Y30_16135 [Spirochaetes bacterium GWE1_32_154]OHD48508.1 MAG: hypothetical protein A2Y29_14110 [Spirochaetes bacterium GWE2_31_10]OHD51422.1 MAG: hypothetical protein A2015_10395 [Spirochaetes bacterium GWF1_31_7]OHD82431.1 MAG: hypothetical protein A2355_05580 [Spirochaetes bacterium RIFOXYB1_FULL_32_8]